MVSFHLPDGRASVSLDPHNLPDYALRSSLRMFIALGCSTVFTLIYGSLAAHNRRTEAVLSQLFDILQSMPVLSLLLITVTGFIVLFPGSLLGLEAALLAEQRWLTLLAALVVTRAQESASLVELLPLIRSGQPRC